MCPFLTALKNSYTKKEGESSYIAKEKRSVYRTSWEWYDASSDFLDFIVLLRLIKEIKYDKILAQNFQHSDSNVLIWKPSSKITVHVSLSECHKCILFYIYLSTAKKLGVTEMPEQTVKIEMNIDQKYRWIWNLGKKKGGQKNRPNVEMSVPHYSVVFKRAFQN